MKTLTYYNITNNRLHHKILDRTLDNCNRFQSKNSEVLLKMAVEKTNANEVDIPIADLKKTVVGAAVGNLIEWFDYATYGYLATVLAAVFFAPGNQVGSLLATFAVFAVSFVVRPLGGLIWGYYGDKIGR